jgi:hypothetical protein
MDRNTNQEKKNFRDLVARELRLQTFPIPVQGWETLAYYFFGVFSYAQWLCKNT